MKTKAKGEGRVKCEMESEGVKGKKCRIRKKIVINDR